MFNKKLNIMLYVKDVAAERDFWKAVGFTILEEKELMGSLSVDMAITADADTIFTLYDKETIRQMSPEVADNQPSILFQTSDLAALHEKVATHAPVCNPISDVPFRHFNFATPSGEYYAVTEI